MTHLRAHCNESEITVIVLYVNASAIKVMMTAIVIGDNRCQRRLTESMFKVTPMTWRCDKALVILMDW